MVGILVGGVQVTGESYLYARPYREAGEDVDAETGAFYARIRHERKLNHQCRIFARTTGSGLAPGQVLEPQAYPMNKAASICI